MLKVPITEDSNSGAHFLRDDVHFHKQGTGLATNRIKCQALWIAALQGPQVERFVPLRFAYWNASEAIHTSRWIDMPTAANWLTIASDEQLVRLLTVIKSVISWICGSLHSPEAPTETLATRHTFTQTSERITAWNLPREWVEWLHRETLVINGIAYRGLPGLMSEVGRIVYSGKYDRSAPSAVHGDVHLGNILTNLDQWWLIDPRGRFAGGSTFFDPYYEWGKLLHECHSLYSLLIGGGVKLSLTNANSVIMETRSSKLYHFYHQFRTTVISELDNHAAQYGEDYLSRQKALLYEGLILLGVVTFHQQDTHRALLLATAGIVVLNRFINGEESTLAQSLVWESPINLVEDDLVHRDMTSRAEHR